MIIAGAFCPRRLPARTAKEFSTSNFFAVTADGRFVTPDSPTVLGSITNKSLMQLAEDQGMKVERRPVPMSEVGTFAEVAACGTAVVITPIKQILNGDEVRRVPEARRCLAGVCLRGHGGWVQWERLR